VEDPERCTGCQLCQLHCPDFAINVRSPKKKEGKKSTDKVEEVANE
jgi:NAD-dependent dihydropyrimidine dehydrogenase PreA subunit